MTEQNALTTNLQVPTVFRVGREGGHSVTQDLAEEAYNKSLEILQSPGNEIGSILPAIRRISSLYGEPPTSVGLNHFDDLSYDLRGSGVTTTKQKVKKSLFDVDSLCYLYYPLAEKMAAIKYSQCRDYFDYQEIIDLAKGMVEKTIWSNGGWYDKDPETAAQELVTRIRGNLNHLPEAALRLFRFGKFEQLSADEDAYEEGSEDRLSRSLEMAYFDPQDENPFPDASEKSDYYNPNATPVADAKDSLTMLAQKIGLENLTYLITRLDKREQVTILAYLGYLGNERQLKDIQANLGFSRHLMNLAIVNGVRHLEEFNDPGRIQWLKDHSKEPIYPQTIARELASFRPLHMNNRAAHADSSRFSIITALQETPQNLCSLKTMQTRLIELATAHDGTRFLYNNAQIAKELGVKTDYVENELAELGKLARGEHTQYVNDDDKVLKVKDSQVRMILLKGKLEPWVLSGLSEKQQHAFMFLTTPGPDGRYPSWEMAQKSIGVTSTGFFTEILQKHLENAESIAKLGELRSKLAWAMQNLDQFQENHQQIIQYIYTRLEVGISLRGETGGLGYHAIGRQLGIPASQITLCLKQSLTDKYEKAMAKLQEV